MHTHILALTPIQILPQTRTRILTKPISTNALLSRLHNPSKAPMWVLLILIKTLFAMNHNVSPEHALLICECTCLTVWRVSMIPSAWRRPVMVTKFVVNKIIQISGYHNKDFTLWSLLKRVVYKITLNLDKTL